MNNPVSNNPAVDRFELAVDGHIAAAYYELAGGVITFVHTEVPPELGGKGIGSKLIRGALDQVRADGMKVIAQCPFVKTWIDKHPDLCRPAESIEIALRYGLAPSCCRLARAVLRSGRSSSAFLKSAIAPALSPSRNFAWPRLFHE
jgi:uncharacterized protein